MTTPQPLNTAFAGFDVALQPIAYPAAGLTDNSASAADAVSSVSAERLAEASPEQAEIARLRIENAQLQRKLFQKQQQIGRLMDHVNRLARVLGQLKRSQTAPLVTKANE